MCNSEREIPALPRTKAEIMADWDYRNDLNLEVLIDIRDSLQVIADKLTFMAKV